MTLAAGFLTVPLAHRGLHDATARRPENSRASVEAAIALGYGVEIDVQCSADGRAMVFHDADLPRLTGEVGRVRERDAGDLAEIRLLGGAQTIPALAEILALVAGRAPLLIEIKDQTGSLSAGDGRLERSMVDDLQGYRGPVAIMSFNPHAVAAMARLAPNIPRGLTTCAFRARDWAAPEETLASLRRIAAYEATGAEFISHDAADLARPSVARLREAGAGVLCWTIRSEAGEADARRVADNITFEGYLPTRPG